MTYVIAQHIHPGIPHELTAKVGTILEREYRANFPNASRREVTRDSRAIVAMMDALEMIDVVCAEGQA